MRTERGIPRSVRTRYEKVNFEGRENQVFPTGRYRARNQRSVALGSAQCFSPFRPKLFGIYCFHHCDSGCARDVKASGDLDHANLLEISHTGEHTSLRVEKINCFLPDATERTRKKYS